MSFLGNIIWLVTSFFIPLGYLIGGIILFPLLPFIYPVIGYSFLPFGREIVSTKYLKQFKDYEKTGGKDFDNASGIVRFLANIVWVLTFCLDTCLTSYPCRNFKRIPYLDNCCYSKYYGTF